MCSAVVVLAAVGGVGVALTFVIFGLTLTLETVFQVFSLLTSVGVFFVRVVVMPSLQYFSSRFFLSSARSG